MFWNAFCYSLNFLSMCVRTKTCSASLLQLLWMPSILPLAKAEHIFVNPKTPPKSMCLLARHFFLFSKLHLKHVFLSNAFLITVFLSNRFWMSFLFQQVFSEFYSFRIFLAFAILSFLSNVFVFQFSGF